RSANEREWEQRNGSEEVPLCLRSAHRGREAARPGLSIPWIALLPGAGAARLVTAGWASRPAARPAAPPAAAPLSSWPASRPSPPFGVERAGAGGRASPPYSVGPPSPPASHRSAPLWPPAPARSAIARAVLWWHEPPGGRPSKG